MLLFMADTLAPQEKKKLQIMYERYGKKMFAAANRILNDKSLAEDALQNSFVSMASRIDRININDEDGLEGYVIAVVKNAAYDLIRDRMPQTDDDVTAVCDEWQDAEKKVLIREAYEKAVALMREMDDRYRTPLYLNCVMGYSVKEISKMLHRNEKTVLTQIFRGKKLLADQLRETGYER
ncbi:MAG: sigma-70 family RNA polymerase sigma factor [Clostridia bacterium]|nr:sigma-70 family RNA polymerase sigma factor [Clostridia bacterium]